MSKSKKLIVTGLVVAFVVGCDLFSRITEYKIDPINTLPDNAFFLTRYSGACGIAESLGIWGDAHDFPTDDDPSGFTRLNPGQSAFFQLDNPLEGSDQPVQTYCSNTTTNGNNWQCPEDTRYVRVSRGLRQPGFVLHCYSDVSGTDSDLPLITSSRQYQDELVKHCAEGEATAFHDVARGLRTVNPGQVLDLNLPASGIQGILWFCGGVEQARYECPTNSVVGLVTRVSSGNFLLVECFL